MSADRTIHALELAIARRDLGAIPGGYERVLDEAFVEVGSSGRVWTREATLRALGSAVTEAIEIEEFEAAEIRPGVYLARYLAVAVRSSDGVTLRSWRSSIWLRDGRAYRLRFHQGTPLPDTLTSPRGDRRAIAGSAPDGTATR